MINLLIGLETKKYLVQPANSFRFSGGKAEEFIGTGDWRNTRDEGGGHVCRLPGLWLDKGK